MTGVNNSVLYTWKLLWADLKCSHHNTSSLSDVHHEISACMPPVMGRSLPYKATPLIFGQLWIGFTGFSLSLCVMCSLTVFQVTSREVGVFKPRSSDSRVCVLESTPNSWFLLASSVAFSWTVLHPAPKWSCKNADGSRLCHFPAWNSPVATSGLPV